MKANHFFYSLYPTLFSFTGYHFSSLSPFWAWDTVQIQGPKWCGQFHSYSWLLILLSYFELTLIKKRYSCYFMIGWCQSFIGKREWFKTISFERVQIKLDCPQGPDQKIELSTDKIGLSTRPSHIGTFLRDYSQKHISGTITVYLSVVEALRSA